MISSISRRQVWIFQMVHSKCEDVENRNLILVYDSRDHFLAGKENRSVISVARTFVRNIRLFCIRDRESQVQPTFCLSLVHLNFAVSFSPHFSLLSLSFFIAIKRWLLLRSFPLRFVLNPLPPRTYILTFTLVPCRFLLSQWAVPVS